MSETLPDFALMIGLPDTSETGFSDDCLFRCFSCIENLCDFIDDRLVVPGAFENYESFSQNDWKRLRKNALEITGQVRRGFLLEDADRKALNTVLKPLIFRISWWGKFSILLKSAESPATTARHYYYVQKSWRLYDWRSDREPDPIDYPKSIKKAEIGDFHRCLQEQMNDELGF